MKIAVLHFHRLGGSGIVAYEIARGMLERGHEVHFVGLSSPFRMHDRERSESGRLEDGLYFHRVEYKFYPVFEHQPYDLALASKLTEVIESFEIDVVHCHYAIPHTAAALLAREMAVKRGFSKKLSIVTTLHGTDVSVVGSDDSMFCITRYLIESSDVAISVSDYLKKKTEELFQFDKNVIKRIYNFLPRDFFPPKSNECIKSTTRERIVLHSSTLREVKAPLDVIEIFQMLLQKTKIPLKLVIAGDGPLKNSMKIRVEALGLSEQVSFLGVVNDMKSVYANASFFLLPSYEESFGLAALEAMAFGIPVLAAKSGGLVEIIQDGVNGFLFSNRNLAEGVEKLVRLLQNDDFYCQVSRQAAKTARVDFSAKDALDAYEMAYQTPVSW